MTNNELLILNLREIRRRSIRLWEGLEQKNFDWKPDSPAMTASEIIRHVLSADCGWNVIINQQDISSFHSPWEGKPFHSLKDELEFAKPQREALLNSIRKFTTDELASTDITHPGTQTQRKLGDYIMRIGYHESVHAGQFMSYLRGMGAKRPFIWD